MRSWDQNQNSYREENTQDDWSKLSFKERAALIGLGVQNNIYDINTIRDTYNKYASGGNISIKPENRGKFTELKERTGKSSTWYKEHGTPEQKKMAVFALNARKWNHKHEGTSSDSQLHTDDLELERDYSRAIFGEPNLIKTQNSYKKWTIDKNTGLRKPIQYLSNVPKGDFNSIEEGLNAYTKHLKTVAPTNIHPNNATFYINQPNGYVSTYKVPITYGFKNPYEDVSYINTPIKGFNINNVSAPDLTDSLHTRLKEIEKITSKPIQTFTSPKQNGIIVPKHLRSGLATIKNGKTYYEFDGYSSRDVVQALKEIFGQNNYPTDDNYYIEDSSDSSDLLNEPENKLSNISTNTGIIKTNNNNVVEKNNIPVVEKLKNTKNQIKESVKESAKELFNFDLHNKLGKLKSYKDITEIPGYVYPHRTVEMWQIDPEIANIVKEKLLQNAKKESNLEKEYIFSSEPLKNLPQGQLNDSIFNDAYQIYNDNNFQIHRSEQPYWAIIPFHTTSRNIIFDEFGENYIKKQYKNGKLTVPKNVDIHFIPNIPSDAKTCLEKNYKLQQSGYDVLRKYKYDNSIDFFRAHPIDYDKDGYYVPYPVVYDGYRLYYPHTAPAEKVQSYNTLKADGGALNYIEKNNKRSREDALLSAVKVFNNYADAKDNQMNKLETKARITARYLSDWGINPFGSGISNCTLTASQWVNPDNPLMRAASIVENSNPYFTKISKEYAIPGDLLITKNPKHNSYHTMMITGFENNVPLLTYSAGGTNTEKELRKNIPLNVYHIRDTEQGGNHTEDLYYRPLYNNEVVLPEVVVTPNGNFINYNNKAQGGYLQNLTTKPFSYYPIPTVRYDNGGHLYGLGSWLKKLLGLDGIDDNDIAVRQAYAESGFDSNAVSPTGAAGIFQIRQNALDDYNKANNTNYKTSDLKNDTLSTQVRNWIVNSYMNRPWNTKENMPDSIRYARTLAAHNFGATNMLNGLNKAKADGKDIYGQGDIIDWSFMDYWPKETRDYVNFILRGQDNSLHRNEAAFQVKKKLKSKTVKTIKNTK